MTSNLKDWRTELAILPVSRFFSEKSWMAIHEYLESGSAQQRKYRMVEFLKALDWLPIEEIAPNPLRQFAPSDARRIKTEISDYFADKQDKRKTQREKQEAYRLRVFEYYRAHLSSQEKVMLESLRDYELERIGTDVNWRHFFWFTSFKQIDAFVQQTPRERKTVIHQFKQDVEQHFKNAERLRNGSYADYYWGPDCASAGETFDDWLNRQVASGSSQANGDEKQKRQYTASSPGSSALQDAYRTLGVSPLAPLPEIRAQFRRLALQFHPDLADGNEEKMKQLLASYNIVKKVRQTADEMV